MTNDIDYVDSYPGSGVVALEDKTMKQMTNPWVQTYSGVALQRSSFVNPC